MSSHVACLWVCVLFYLFFVCLHVCAYVSKFEVHCGRAFEPGASGLPYYCSPPVCVPDVLGALAVWRHWHNKKNTGQILGSYVANRVLAVLLGRRLTLSLCLSELLLLLQIIFSRYEVRVWGASWGRS